MGASGAESRCSSASFVAALPRIALRWRLRLRSRLSIEEFLGSGFHGSLGWALKPLLCARPGGRACAPEAACGAPSGCAFADLYQSERAVRARGGATAGGLPSGPVLRVPPAGTRTIPAGGTIEVGAVLVGRAGASAHALVEAVRRLAAEPGGGLRGARFGR